MPLFHVASRDVDVLQDLLEFGEVAEGRDRIADIGLADDLDQRNAGPVQIDVTEPVAVFEPVVNRLAGVVLEVDPRDADAL